MHCKNGETDFQLYAELLNNDKNVFRQSEKMRPGVASWPHAVNICRCRAASVYFPQAGPTSLLQLDFHIHPGWQIQLHQGVHGLVGGIDNIHESLVGADFELVAAGLVDVR